jgi:putative membrane protein insertion efficiency factor
LDSLSFRRGKLTVILLCVFTGALTTPLAAEGDSEKEGSPATSAIRFYQKNISDLRYGHCYFEPSCSQYGYDAIESHGFFKGITLAADRLIRCNASAVHYHERSPGGRLADPVDGPQTARRRPEVPAWLLPEFRDGPLPVPDVGAQMLDYGLTRRKGASELLEYVEFADMLAKEGDCWRAETEYKRVVFLSGSVEVDRWALMKTGSCYYRWKSWDESAPRFLEAAALSVKAEERNVAHYMAAASFFNAGRYAKSVKTLDRCVREDEEVSEIATHENRTADGGPDAATGAAHRLAAEKIQFLQGLCAMASGDWNGGAERFKDIAADYPNSLNRNRALFLRWKAEEGAGDVPRKHPNLAAGLSVVIPGSGQMYTGRYYDGFRHLVVNGLLIFSVYQLFQEEYYAAGYLLVGFTLPFYVGNIVGAKRSAESYNSWKRAGYVSQVIEEAGAE